MKNPFKPQKPESNTATIQIPCWRCNELFDIDVPRDLDVMAASQLRYSLCGKCQAKEAEQFRRGIPLRMNEAGRTQGDGIRGRIFNLGMAGYKASDK